MLISEVAQRLGISAQTLRLGLQQEKFPFGVAIKTSQHRHTYYINPKALERYLEGVITPDTSRNLERHKGI